jgi:hypothetical protein
LIKYPHTTEVRHVLHRPQPGGTDRPGQAYAATERVVSIVIADYDMIDSDKSYRHVFRLYGKENGVLLTDVYIRKRKGLTITLVQNLPFTKSIQRC